MTEYVHADTGPLLDTVRRLFLEYRADIGLDLCFQSFDAELADLPGKYAPPEGCIILALQDGEPAGCVALRPHAPGVCEMKRLYVRPGFRGLGLGRALAEQVIEHARTLGYGKMCLDTLDSMTAAVTLYLDLGFTRREPYYDNPLCGATFFELDLNPD